MQCKRRLLRVHEDHHTRFAIPFSLATQQCTQPRVLFLVALDDHDGLQGGVRHRGAIGARRATSYLGRAEVRSIRPRGEGGIDGKALCDGTWRFGSTSEYPPPEEHGETPATPG
eukprot:scaffold83105_cov67-Phaeocystis_antarctica.AAC.16